MSDARERLLDTWERHDESCVAGGKKFRTGPSQKSTDAFLEAEKAYTIELGLPRGTLHAILVAWLRTGRSRDQALRCVEVAIRQSCEECGGGWTRTPKGSTPEWVADHTLDCSRFK